MESISPLGSILDWIRRRREESQGLAPGGATTAPADTGPTRAPEAAAPQGAAPGYDPYDPTLPFPAGTTDNLERFYNDVKDLENEIHRLRQIVGDTTQPLLRRDQAQEQLVIAEASRRERMTQIGQEENRRADNARADAAAKSAEERRQEAERKAEAEKTAAREREQATTPGEGQTRRVPVSWTGEYGPAQGTVEERYSKGVWSRVPNSFTPEEGFGGTGQTATGRLELSTAELNLRVAQQKFDEAASPEAKERARLELETAKLGLAQAQRVLDKPSETTADGYLVRVTPGGELTRIDTLTPQQRAQQDELAGLTLEKARQGAQPAFTDAVAAYNAQAPRLQQAAQAELDRLTSLQRQGAISEGDAQKQFTAWFAGNVEGPLAGYRTAAEEAQRKEQREQEALQRVEDVRAENANRARETVGYQAGEQARLEAMRVAPQARTPQFLNQLGSAVASMSNRARAKSAEEAGRLPAGPRFTADTFDPKHWAGSVPDLSEVARAATARALSSISPAVAASIGAPIRPLPVGPALTSLLSQVPYRGPLSALPSPASGLLPTPGMNPALDIGGGLARTPYGPTGSVFYDWQLPQGP